MPISQATVTRVRDFTVKPGSAFRFHIVCEIHSESEMCEMPDMCEMPTVRGVVEGHGNILGLGPPPGLMPLSTPKCKG